MNRNEAIQESVLRELYIVQQMSGSRVAATIGASSAAVYNALIRYGIPLRKHSQASRLRWKHTWQADWAQLARDYEGGKTLEEIAKSVGCSMAAASEHLAQVTELRPRGTEVKPNSRGKIEIDIMRAVELNQNGATLTEISSKLPNHPSIQVLSKRFREAGQRVLVHKASKDRFKNLQAKKRVVAHVIGATCCQVCDETRGVQLCHIQARRKGGSLNPDNAVPLCPSHHWYFDHGLLTKTEARKLKSTLRAAAAKGYTHHHYEVAT